MLTAYTQTPVLKTRKRSVEPNGQSAFFLWELPSNHVIETSLLYLTYRFPRYVACLPSQQSCNCRCKFCGLSNAIQKASNLDWETLYTLVISMLSAKIAPHDAIQLSFMGQGEPLFNIENISLCYKQLKNDYPYRDWSCGISTIGIPSLYNKLLNDNELALATKLQISLHASNDKLRNELMPYTVNYSINLALEGAEKYARQTKHKVAINYLLLNGVNDSITDVQQLADLINPEFFYVKLSYYNDVCNNTYKSATSSTFDLFTKVLEDKGIEVTRFKSIGQKIGSGCGQIGLFNEFGSSR